MVSGSLKLVFIIVGVVLVLAVLGLIFFVPGSAKIKDCGEDIDCLIKAAETCSPAKMVYTTNNLFTASMGLIVKDYFEIRKSGSGCKYYMLILENKIKYPQELIQNQLDSGLTLEEINAAEQRAQRQAEFFEGKEVECFFSDNGKLKKYFEDTKVGGGGFSCTFDMGNLTSKCTSLNSEGLPIEYNCSGSLADLYSNPPNI